MRTVLHDILDRGHFSPTTHEKYKLVIDSWIAFAGENPRGWTRIAAQDFYQGLLSRVQVNSANVYMASLRYVSKWFAIRENRPELDFAVVQLEEPTDVKTRRALTQEEAELILATCGGKITPVDRRDRTMIIVGLETGMRRMSLAGLSYEAIKLGSSKNGYPAALVPIKGRGGKKTFEVPLSDVATKIIGDWQRWLGAQKVSRGPLFPRLTRKLTTKGLLHVPTDTGISATMIHKIISQRATEAGIKHAHPHLLRHTFITWREAAGLSSAQIASITGHTITDMGGLGDYVDLKQVGAVARNTTPPWLVELVDKLVEKGSR